MIFVDGMRAGAYERAGTFDRHTDLGVYSAGRDVLPPALVDRVRAVDGVAAAAGELTNTAGIVGADGRPVLGFTIARRHPHRGRAALVRRGGRPVARPGREVVLDAPTAAEQGFGLGAAVRIGATGARPARTPWSAPSTWPAPPATSAVRSSAWSGRTPWPSPASGATAGSWWRPDRASDVAALTEKVRAVSGADATVKSRQQILDEAVEDAVRNVDQFRMLLLIFVGVAIVVAGFVIANTFAIVLAQRTRRTALLRLVGATRGQVFRATLLESAVLGLVASALGVLLGVGPRRRVAAAAGPDWTCRSPVGLTLTGSTVLHRPAAGHRAHRRAPPCCRPGRAHGSPRWPRSPTPRCSPARGAGRVRLSIGAVVLAVGVGRAGRRRQRRSAISWWRSAGCSPSSGSCCSGRCSSPRWPGCSAGRSDECSAPP